MADLPVHAVLWSANDEIAKVQRQNIVNAVFLTFAGFFVVIISFKILNIFGANAWAIQIPIAVLIAFLLWKQLYRTMKRMHLLNMVAIGKGHPWHPSESVEHTTVLVSDGESWHRIPDNARIFILSDSSKQNTVLQQDDMNGKVLLRWDFSPDNITKKVVSLINQALAIRDAQERMTSGEDLEDPIEKARSREDEEFYPVDRVWEETRQGSLAPEPGVLLRKMRSRGSDILKKRDD
jgi:hypothetical protein